MLGFIREANAPTDSMEPAQYRQCSVAAPTAADRDEPSALPTTSAAFKKESAEGVSPMGVALEHQGRLCSRCGRPISPSVDGCSCLARQDAVASGAAPTSTRLGLLQSPWRRFAISLGVAAAAAGYGLLVGPPSGRLEVLLALVGFASLFWGRTLRFSLAALAVLVVLAPFVGARPGMLYPIVVAMAAAVAPGVKAWSRLLNTVVLAGIAIGAPSFATSAWAGSLRNVAFWAVVVFACIGLSHWLEAHVPHRTSVIHHRHR